MFFCDGFMGKLLTIQGVIGVITAPYQPVWVRFGCTLVRFFCVRRRPAGIGRGLGFEEYAGVGSNFRQ